MSARDFASKAIEGGAPARFRATSAPASWHAKSRKAGRIVDLAHSYWEDGALFSAAAKLREAADLLEKAAKQRDDLLGLPS